MNFQKFALTEFWKVCLLRNVGKRAGALRDSGLFVSSIRILMDIESAQALVVRI